MDPNMSSQEEAKQEEFEGSSGAPDDTVAQDLIRRINNGDRRALLNLSALAASPDEGSKEVFEQEDEFGNSALDLFLATLPSVSEHPRSLIDKSIDNIPVPNYKLQFLEILLKCTPPGNGEYTRALADCRAHLGKSRYEAIFMDATFHRTLNCMMCKRSFTTLFMIDFYLRVLLVVMWTISSNDAVNGKSNPDWSFALLYIADAYLLIWHFRLMATLELYFLRDVWNVLDFGAQILVLVAAGTLHADNALTSGLRTLYVVTGALVWGIILTSALRSTFLPFSVFVEGVTRILLYMIPFGTTTFLMFGSFADMYFKSVVGTSDCTNVDDPIEFCEWKSSLLNVYSMFVAGIDASLLTVEASKNLLWLTVFYGFFFAIVLLNVLVAVVFDAWGKVSPRGHFFFWKHRHQFLLETREISYVKGFQSKWIDKLDEHLNGVLARFFGRPLQTSESKELLSKLKHVACYFLEMGYLVLWFVAGFLSVSILWPRSFRRTIFTFRGEDDDLKPVSQVLVASDPEVKELKESVEELKQLVREMAASQKSDQ